VEATTEDVVYVIEGVREAFPSLELGNVLYTMAGLRALADSGNRSTRDLSRKYEVVDHEKRDGVGGLISVLGGKITTYRAVAEDTMNLVCHKLGSKTPSSTTHIPLPGAPSPSQEAMEQNTFLYPEHHLLHKKQWSRLRMKAASLWIRLLTWLTSTARARSTISFTRSNGADCV